MNKEVAQEVGGVSIIDNYGESIEIYNALKPTKEEWYSVEGPPSRPYVNWALLQLGYKEGGLLAVGASQWANIDLVIEAAQFYRGYFGEEL